MRRPADGMASKAPVDIGGEQLSSSGNNACTMARRQQSRPSATASICLIISAIFVLICHGCFCLDSPNGAIDSSRQRPTAPKPTVTDLVVNIGENVLLECDAGDDASERYHHYGQLMMSVKRNRYGRLYKRDNNAGEGEGEGAGAAQLSPEEAQVKYVWCRYERSPDETVDQNGSLHHYHNRSHHPANNAINHNHNHAAHPNGFTLGPKREPTPIQNNKTKTCFEGDRYFVANENQISTVIYRCEMHKRLRHGGGKWRQKDPKRNDAIDQSMGHYNRLPDVDVDDDRATVIGRRMFKLYVDQFASVFRKREIFEQYRLGSLAVPPLPRGSCRAPRCKPYATVKSAHCTRIELQIRYPTSQYGYNRSIDYWGTIQCDDQITGFQLWLIGYGVVKKYKLNDPIVVDNLVPGKRYCFNGWAYNRCGAGPVFTLEGVCAKNTEDCHNGSDEHCELDVDYSF